MTNTTSEHYKDFIGDDIDEILERLNYQGTQGKIKKRFGPEIEFFVVSVENGHMRSIDNDEAKLLLKSYEAYTEFNLGKKKSLDQEAIASHFELNFGPVDLDNFEEQAKTQTAHVHALFRVAKNLGFRIIPSSHAPHIKGADDVMDQLVDRERIQHIFKDSPDSIDSKLIKFANLCAGIHVSNCYEDIDDMYDNARRTYYLTPLIYALSNNGFPFWMGMKDSHGVNPRYQVIHDFAKTSHGLTGTDPLFLKAESGEDYLRSYIERVFSLPLMAYYPTELSEEDIKAGHTHPEQRSTIELGATPEKPITFSDLVEKGLGTVSNFFYAASCQWFGGKLPLVPQKAENNYPYVRWENRIWDTGTWQLNASMLIEALMNSDKDCGREIDELLETAGFPADGPAHSPNAPALMKDTAFDTIGHSGKEGLHFQFGTMDAQKFAEKFIAVLTKHAKKYELEHHLEALNDIIMNKRTDAQVLQQLCRTPEDVVRFVEEFEPDVLLQHSNKSFGMLLDMGLLPTDDDEEKPQMPKKKHDGPHPHP